MCSADSECRPSPITFGSLPPRIWIFPFSTLTYKLNDGRSNSSTSAHRLGLTCKWLAVCTICLLPVNRCPASGYSHVSPVQQEIENEIVSLARNRKNFSLSAHVMAICYSDAVRNFTPDLADWRRRSVQGHKCEMHFIGLGSEIVILWGIWCKLKFPCVLVPYLNQELAAWYHSFDIWQVDFAWFSGLWWCYITCKIWTFERSPQIMWDSTGTLFKSRFKPFG